MNIQDFLDCTNCEYQTTEWWGIDVKDGEKTIMPSCKNAKPCERLWWRWNDKLAEVDS